MEGRLENPKNHRPNLTVFSWSASISISSSTSLTPINGLNAVLLSVCPFFFCRSVLRFFILALFYRSVSFDSIISAPMTCQLFTEGFAFAPLCSIGDVKRSKKKNQLELGVRVRQQTPLPSFRRAKGSLWLNIRLNSVQSQFDVRFAGFLVLPLYIFFLYKSVFFSSVLFEFLFLRASTTFFERRTLAIYWGV